MLWDSLVQALTKFIAKQNFLERFKPPPPPPPPPPPKNAISHVYEWFGGGMMTSSETFTMSIGPHGEIIETGTETFSWRL